MAIHQIPAKPAHKHPELVAELAKYLDPQRASDAGPGIPEILEQAQIYGNNLHVRVVWDKWNGVPHPERGPIILDAYRVARGDQEMLRVSLPQGFTPEEAQRLNLPGFTRKGN